MKRIGVVILAVLVLAGLSVSTVSYANNDCALSYTVQRGDWLIRIAQRYGLNWQDIARLNHLANPNRLYLGQVLCLKAGAAVTESTAVPIVVAPAPVVEQPIATPMPPAPVVIEDVTIPKPPTALPDNCAWAEAGYPFCWEVATPLPPDFPAECVWFGVNCPVP